MKKFLLSITVAAGVMITGSPWSAPASASIQDAHRLAEQAFWEIDENFDWNAGINNFQQAIEVSDDTCLDTLYREYLDITIEARDMRADGVSERATYQLWNHELSQVEADCYD